VTRPVVAAAFPDRYAYFDWKQLHRSSFAAIVNQPCTMWDGARERVVSCETLAEIEGGYGGAYAYEATDVAIAPPCVVVDPAAPMPYRRPIIERY
jgi:hypothetical protein